jgi:hypothetical protein
MLPYLGVRADKVSGWGGRLLLGDAVNPAALEQRPQVDGHYLAAGVGVAQDGGRGRVRSWERAPTLHGRRTGSATFELLAAQAAQLFTAAGHVREAARCMVLSARLSLTGTDS